MTYKDHLVKFLALHRWNHASESAVQVLLELQQSWLSYNYFKDSPLYNTTSDSASWSYVLQLTPFDLRSKILSYPFKASHQRERIGVIGLEAQHLSSCKSILQHNICKDWRASLLQTAAISTVSSVTCATGLSAANWQIWRTQLQCSSEPQPTIAKSDIKNPTSETTREKYTELYFSNLGNVASRTDPGLFLDISNSKEQYPSWSPNELEHLTYRYTNSSVSPMQEVTIS